MVQTHRFLVPHFRGHLRLEKPPLMYWIVAAAYALDGTVRSAIAARLPTVIALAVLAGVLCVRGERMENRFTGLFAAGSLGTFLLMQRLGRQAETDIMLLLFVSLATLSAVDGLRSGRWFPWLLAGGCMGLGFLTKGPAGIAMPLAAVAGVAVLEHRFDMKHLAAAAAALGIALAVGLPWYVYLRFGSGAAEEAREVLSQEVGALARSGSHPGAWYFYLLRVPLLTMPWTAAVVLGAVDGWRQRRGHALVRTALAWLGTTVLLLSCLHQKQAHYVLLALPPAALLAGWWSQRALRDPGWRRTVLVVTVAVPLCGLAVASLALPVAAHSGYAEWNIWTGALLVCGLAVGGGGLVFLRSREVVKAWAFAALAVALAGWLYLMSVYPSVQPEAAIPGFVAEADKLVPANAPVVVAGPWASSCMYYSRHRTVYRKKPGDAFSDVPEGAWVLISFPSRRRGKIRLPNIEPAAQTRSGNYHLMLVGPSPCPTTGIAAGPRPRLQKNETIQ
jgi:4-amino-4-deoxy-L-arabinose transferase-like glycosyltransferase